MGLPLDQVPCWFSYSGFPITILNGCFGVFAQDGANFIQLDGTASTNQEGIFQNIPTIEGKVYLLSFWVRARNPAKADTDDEAVIVSQPR